MKILCIGSQWRGGNDGGLFRAFSRLGYLIDIVDEFYYINFRSESLHARFADKLIRETHVSEFNKAIIRQFNKFKPDLVFVYKGTWVKEQTIKYVKNKSCRVVNFFPDVSFLAHGKNIPGCIKHYDTIFSTKTFAKDDLKTQFNYDNVHFIPHGFDPEIHRVLKPEYILNSPFKCQASFIGTYSPHKNEYLSFLIKSIPNLELKIWGYNWRFASKNLKPFVMHETVNGDLYTLAIQSSEINIALLSEIVKGASSGDRITSRTFHIPGSGGFMLHQRTEELQNYFDENKEIGCFNSKEELAQKISYFLNNKESLDVIKEAGIARSWKEHKLDNRAETIIKLIGY